MTTSDTSTKLKPYELKSERIINQFDYDLTPDQQRTIEKYFIDGGRLSLDVITKDVYDLIDPPSRRSKEYVNVKKYIAKLRRKNKPVEFKDSDIDFIKNNGIRMTPKEIGLELFPKLQKLDKLKVPLSREVQAIAKLGEALGVQFEGTKDNYASNEYFPPKADSAIIRKINMADVNVNFPITNLNGEQRRMVDSLRKYLHSYRFKVVASTYKRQDFRDLFENTFIQGTFDKPDLNTEEFNMYISLCSEYVLAAQIQEQMEMINERLNKHFDPQNDEAMKNQQQLTAAFTVKVKEYDDCQKRMAKYQDSLAGSRSQRLKTKIQENQSLVQFVEKWKDNDERKKMLIIARANQLEIENEVDRIESISEYIARVAGISKDEILNL